MLDVVKQYGYTNKNDRVSLQCFDYNEVKRIKTELEPQRGMNLKMVQLIAATKWHETQQQKNGKW